MSELFICEVCGKSMSSEAEACPHCGQPNKVIKEKGQSSQQGCGCVIFLIGAAMAVLIHPLVGLILIAAGILVFLLSFMR